MNKNENLKKKKYFFFPKIEIKHSLFLFFFLVSFLKNYLKVFLEKKPKLQIEFLILYMSEVGDFLSIIPYLIMKKRSKTKNINKNKNKKIQKDDIYSNLSINKKIILLHNEQEDNRSNVGLKVKIFLYTIFDFIAQISSVIFYIFTKKKLVDLNSSLIFGIITIIFFSKIILHTNLYRHHWLCFLIDILCLLGLTAIDLLQIDKNKFVNNFLKIIIYLIIKLFTVTLYSFAKVLAKAIYLYDFISPYSLLFIKSIIEFFYLLIFSIVFIFYKLEDEEDKKEKIIFLMIQKIFKDKKYIAIVIAYTINSFFYNILELQIINVFSPNHCVIARVFEYFGIFIIDLINKGFKSVEYLIPKIIMHVLLILASFIFNEFIVINICGLAKDTKLFLDYEAENEMHLENSEENLDSSNSNNISLINESVSSVYE